MKVYQVLVFIFLITFITSPFIASASSEWNDDEVRTYEVANFNKIYLEGGYKVILEQSDKPGLRIKADEDAFEYIDVEGDDETLRLKIKKKHFDFESLVLYISFVDLEELHIEGGVKLETKGYVDLTDFYLHVEGGAKIEMEMKVDRLDVVGEGGVSFDFKGVAKKIDIKISGAGHLDAGDLKAEWVSFGIEGVGGGSVYATEYLRATIEGVGKIRYKGNPELHKEISGIGFVSRD